LYGKFTGFGDSLLNLQLIQNRVKRSAKIRPHADVTISTSPKKQVNRRRLRRKAAQNLSFRGSETPLRIRWIFFLGIMKASTLSIFVILALVFGACSEDERPGDLIHTMTRYLNGKPVEYAKTSYTYDDNGRIAKSISESPSGDIVSEYVYDANLLTIMMEGNVYSVSKFENEKITQYIVYQEEPDTLNFTYEAGKLTAISYDKTVCPLITDARGNITAILVDGLWKVYEYGKKGTNPFQNISVNFFTYSDVVANRKLDVTALVQYVSKNNAWFPEVAKYAYTYDKVSEIFYNITCFNTSCKYSARLTYRDL
jgi:hypothetical protein